MARYAEEHLADILARRDIVSYIGRYVALKPSGRNFLGLCPFHQEKTPSFSVHRERQFFHCFGCKESGDIFSFVMKYEGLTFPEAVRKLAQEAGVNLPQSSGNRSAGEVRARQKEAECIRANTIAAEYFLHAWRSPAARAAEQYLKTRGIDTATVQLFQIGYAPNRRDGLLRHLKAHGISEEIALDAGLASQRDGRAPYDLFRNRIMFPITDLRGRIVAFGGRALGDVQPKYLNTPQTQLFSKREHLYGLVQARAAVRQQGYVIVCEGYTDVIALAQAGIGNAVASLGTAFTKEQARTLKRLTTEVILAFDGDTAGRTAADRGLDILREEGLAVRVALLPQGQDPDSFVRAHGPEAFLAQLEAAMSLTEFKIEEALGAFDLGSVDGRAGAVEATLPILAGVTSPVAREAYVARIASRVGTSSRAVFAALEQFLQRTGRRTGDRHRIERSRYTTIDSPVRGRDRRSAAEHEKLPGLPQQDTAVSEERTVLWLLLRQPEQIEKVYATLGESPFVRGEHNALFKALRLLANGDLTEAELAPDIAAALHELRSWEPVIVLDLSTYVRRLWEGQMRRNLRRMEVELTRLPERDGKAYAEHVGRLLLAYKRLRQTIAIGTHGTRTG